MSVQYLKKKKTDSEVVADYTRHVSTCAQTKTSALPYKSSIVPKIMFSDIIVVRSFVQFT